MVSRPITEKVPPPTGPASGALGGGQHPNVPGASVHDGGPVWKSALGATGGFGCERAALYREIVRDPRTGYRLDFGMPERVIFGVALDHAHRYLMARRLEGKVLDADMIGIDTSDEGIGEPVVLEQVVDEASIATRIGWERARATRTEAPWPEADWTLLGDRLRTAVDKALGLWPNRTKGDRVPPDAAPERDGTPPGPPIAWLDLEGLSMQEKLSAPDVVGGRGVSGAPDYLWRADGLIVGWVDLKTGGRQISFPGRWAEAEPVTYDYMVTVANGGVAPLWHGYLEYVRVAKPYWQVTVADVDGQASLELARAFFARWGRALDLRDPDAVAFAPRSCASCDFREAIPEAGHPGCPIGAAVMRLAPPDDQEGPER